MSSSPQISIALATYNGDKHLSEQLNSLSEQSLCPAELVVSDDGSSDSTLDILHAFKKQAPFPVEIVVNAYRKGYPDNFLDTMNRCTGEYIACCDQDDVWSADKLKVCALAIASDQPAMLVHRAVAFRDDSDFEFPVSPEHRVGIYRPFGTSPINWPQGMRTMVRTQVFKRFDYLARPNNYQSTETNKCAMSHDEYAYHLCRGYRIRYIPDFLVRYRQHENNAAGAPSVDREVARSLRSATGSQRYRERSDYFENISNFFTQNSLHKEGDLILDAMVRHNLETSRMFDLRSSVHDTSATRSERTQAILRLVRIVTERRVPASEYGAKSLARDLACLLH